MSDSSRRTAAESSAKSAADEPVLEIALHPGCLDVSRVARSGSNSFTLARAPNRSCGDGGADASRAPERVDNPFFRSLSCASSLGRRRGPRRHSWKTSSCVGEASSRALMAPQRRCPAMMRWSRASGCGPNESLSPQGPSSMQSIVDRLAPPVGHKLTLGLKDESQDGWKP